MDLHLLKNKFLLLDTNILVDYTRYAQFFDPLFREFDQHSITLVLDELVKFEFLRGATKPAERNALENYLAHIFYADNGMQQFPLPQEIMDRALEIVNIYQWKLKNNKIELTDCMLAAQLKRYNEQHDQLYLATRNHHDFPLALFDRLGVRTIDVGTQEGVFNIGFYKFNRDKYQVLKEEYQKQ